MIKKTLLTTALFLSATSIANACEISPSYKIQFCAEIMTLKEGETAEVIMEGTNPDDFKIKKVLNSLKITYKPKITQDLTGELVIKDSDGNITRTRPMSIVTKDYTEGYNKVRKGFGELIKELTTE